MAQSNKIDEFIEKHRLWIGGGLLILILVGSGILLWRENYKRPKLESRIANLESRITELENTNIQQPAANIQSTSNNQTSNAPTQGQGQVAGATSQNTAGQDTVKQSAVGKININTASAGELDTLSGIGPTYAQRIIDYRNANGGFKNIDEIKNVKGIGDKTFLKFKDNITI